LIQDHGLEWAAAIAFYSVLSIFPLMIAAIAGIGYFADAGWAIDRATSVLGAFVPDGEEQIEEILRRAVADGRQFGLYAIGALLITGSRVLATLTTALNLFTEEETEHRWWRQLLVQLGMLFAIGLILLLSLGSQRLIDGGRDVLSFLPGESEIAFATVKIIVQALSLFATFALLYWFVPRGPRDRRAVLIGAGVATTLFLISRPLVLIWGVRFSRYEQIYGPLALLVLLLFWAWVVALITLYGAEFSTHARMMRVEGASAEEAGARRTGPR